jgi:exodeoxyribonuclease VII large subunit
MMAADIEHDPETGEIIDGGKPNLSEYSVSEISHALKRTLEDRFGHVRVRGEISGYRGPHASGHCYFAIKDEGAKLDAIIWKGSFARLKAKMQDGLEVVATGKISSYPQKSGYQIIIENIEPAGAGALMALLEERKKKLAAEGLFDAARKKPIPYLPMVIGVVTSPTGAVIRDILHRLNDRFPRHVMVWPVRVQGEGSAAEVAAAIAGFNRMTPRPDLIIVARGGGSLEDLWGFNEEIVVRAVAASEVPLISAVGHETDTTLIDHASDWRAPTPTAAAERAVPVRSELLAQVATLSSRHGRSMSRLMQERATRVTSAARALPRPDEILALARQRFDSAANRLALGLRANTQNQRRRLSEIAPRLSLRALSIVIENDRKSLKTLQDRSIRAVRRALEIRDQRLSGAVKLMASLSYKSVLRRGFALVRDDRDQPIHAAAAIKPGATLAIEFADGRVKVREDSGPKQGRLL